MLPASNIVGALNHKL